MNFGHAHDHGDENDEPPPAQGAVFRQRVQFDVTHFGDGGGSKQRARNRRKIGRKARDDAFASRVGGAQKSVTGLTLDQLERRAHVHPVVMRLMALSKVELAPMGRGEDAAALEGILHHLLQVRNAAREALASMGRHTVATDAVLACLAGLEEYRIRNDASARMLAFLEMDTNAATLVFTTNLHLVLLRRAYLRREGKEPDDLFLEEALEKDAERRRLKREKHALECPEARSKHLRPTKRTHIVRGVRTCRPSFYRSDRADAVAPSESRKKNDRKKNKKKKKKHGASSSGAREREERTFRVDAMKEDFLAEPHGLPFPGRRVSTYTHGMLEMAIRMLQDVFRESQTPHPRMTLYLSALEERLAVLSLEPQPASVMDCVPHRERDLDNEGRFVVSRKRMPHYAALFSSFRERLARYREVSSLPRGDTAPYWDAQEYRRFKRYVIEENGFISGAESMAVANRAAVNNSMDASFEKLCLYLNRPYDSATDIGRATLNLPIFKLFNNIVEGDDLDTFLLGAKTQKDVLLIKDEAFGKGHLADHAFVNAFERLMSSDRFSYSRPQWMAHFVRFDRPKVPWSFPPGTPILAERFGRFDLVFRGRLYETRSSMRAFYLWIKIALEHPSMIHTVRGEAVRQVDGVVLNVPEIRRILEFGRDP